MKKVASMSRNQRISNTIIYILLAILSIIWISPIFMILVIAFNKPDSSAAMFDFSHGFTFIHFIELFVCNRYNEHGDLVHDVAAYPFLKWFINTLLISIVVTFVNTLFILMVSYTMSRLKFKGRKTLMSLNMILGMFPGFMSMIALYNILKLIGVLNPDVGWLYNPRVGLTLCYCMSSGMGFYVAKGFFDTISKSLDEAARIDGATNAQVFFKIIIPLSKPIIVYTLIQAFMGPWMDYILCAIILPEDKTTWTVALGLYSFVNENSVRATYFTEFFSGSVLVSIPIMTLFLLTQKYYVEGVTGGAVKG